jgi:DNA invertase Pin-like site-specific DNA recombinase
MIRAWVVSYLRVRRDRQGQPRPGLLAQRGAVARFCDDEDSTVAAEFIEIETADCTDALDRRPQLLAALMTAKRLNCPLVVARLDGMAADAASLMSLIAPRVTVFIGGPRSNTPFRLLDSAALAEHERRDLRSIRTRASLAVAKAKGLKIGGDWGYRPSKPPNGRLGREAIQCNADARAHQAMTAIAATRAANGRDGSLQGLARALTERGIPTQRGGPWSPTSVRRVLARAARMDEFHREDIRPLSDEA